MPVLLHARALETDFCEAGFRIHEPEVLYSSRRCNDAKRKRLGDSRFMARRLFSPASLFLHGPNHVARAVQCSLTSRSCHASSAWQHGRAFHSATTWSFPLKHSHLPQGPSPVLFSISAGQFWLPTSTSVWFSPRADHVPILVTHVMRVNMH